LLSLETGEQLEIARTMGETSLSVRQLRNLVKTIKEARPSADSSGTLPWEARHDKEKLIGRCIDQVIAALRLALSRMDTVLDRMEKEWVEKEILSQYRISLHNQIDSLIRLKKKLMLASSEDT
jgi:hypothetical protein